MYITVIRQISYETRLKIDTVPLHPTVYTYKTKWAYESNTFEATLIYDKN